MKKVLGFVKLFLLLATLSWIVLITRGFFLGKEMGGTVLDFVQAILSWPFAIIVIALIATEFANVVLDRLNVALGHLEKLSIKLPAGCAVIVKTKNQEEQSKDST